MKKVLLVMFCMLFLTLSMSAGVEKEEKLGLFPVCYNIGTPMAGAKTFRVSLLVYTPGKTLSGYGVITQPVNPPLRIESKLYGDFTYMTVMPSKTHILVTATGYPDIHWPPHGGVGPVLLPIVHLRMVLTEDWKSGTANYKYLDAKGEWQEINDAPVTIVNCEDIKPAKTS